MMKPYQAIACARYDYLELACLRHYQLLLELRDGTTLTGRALDIQTHKDKTEWLLLDTATGQQAHRLDNLIAITPTAPGAEFDRVEIASHQENVTCMDSNRIE